MTTPSQTPETPEASETSKQQTTSTGSSASTTDKTKMEAVSVSKERLACDLALLENGAFTDFTVICGEEEWKTHRSILNRCPYFRPMISEGSAFKEAQESSVTIEGFEPFEIGWLIRYIYGLQVEFEQLRASVPNKTYMETYVFIWSLGDYFCISELCHTAIGRLAAQCKKYFIESRRISSVLPEISFLPELEGGIRAAWRADRVAGPGRKHLVSVCSGLHPYLRDHQSFLNLLGELPEFNFDFVKALLGCPGLQMPKHYERRRVLCANCSSSVFDRTRGEGKQFVERAFVVAPTELNICGGGHKFYCSRECYNACQDSAYHYPEEQLEKA